MRAIYINTAERTAEVIDFTGDFQDIQRLLGVDCFTCVGLDNGGDTLYVDDEGLFKENDFFSIDEYPEPLAGNGLILGTDLETGETVSAIMDMPKNLKFMSRNELLAMMDYYR